MARDDQTTRFEKATALPGESPTLIEGLPGLGMVASITADQITTQLDLERHGTIHSDDFPPVAAFEDGRVRDAVRVYAGDDPPVMTLQSDIPIPPAGVESLSQCVLSDLADEFERAIFLAGTPANSEESEGDVVGVATTDDLENDLGEANIDIAEGSGIIGGVTGALLGACHREDVPAAILIVRSNPYLPDPGAAEALIENALEPLLEFDIDTQELRDQADEIQAQKRQIAEQLKQYQAQQGQDQQSQIPGMYQ